MLWKRLEQQGDAPGARSSHAVAVVGERVYLFGGELQPRVPVAADTYCYDLESSTWSKLATTGTCPGPRVAATMAAVGDRVYLFGGRTGVDMGEGAQADLFVLDTQQQCWSAVHPASGSPSPSPRSYHTMTAANDKLYIFGGCGPSGRLSDLWEFTPDSNNNSNGTSDSCSGSWKQLPSCEAVRPRGGSVMVASSDQKLLYIMGGFSGSSEMDDCHVFDLHSYSWSCPACCCNGSGSGEVMTSSKISSLTMPLARSVFGVAVHGDCDCEGATSGGCCSHAGHIIVFGGEVSPSDKGHAGAGNFTSALHCLTPQTTPSSQSKPAAGPQQVQAVPHASGGEGIGDDISVWHALKASGDAPGPRGWFAAAVVPDGGDLLVHGGLGADNERLGDMYRLCMHDG